MNFFINLQVEKFQTAFELFLPLTVYPCYDLKKA